MRPLQPLDSCAIQTPPRPGYKKPLSPANNWASIASFYGNVKRIFPLSTAKLPTDFDEELPVSYSIVNMISKNISLIEHGPIDLECDKFGRVCTDGPLDN
jgi:hypothetical protein